MLLNLSTKVGGSINRMQLNVNPNQLLHEIWAEIAATFEIDIQNLVVMTLNGDKIIPKDFDKTIENVVKDYGKSFSIIDLSRKVEILEGLAQAKKMPQMAKLLGVTEEEYLSRVSKIADALRDERTTTP